jgi:5-formyltetrahydrofolate cyclo-ligase
MTGAMGEAEILEAQKVALRDRLLTTRHRRRLSEVADDAERIAHHLLGALPVRRAATVAAYVAIGREPGTGPLLAGLRAAGKRVILPVLLPDGDLDWAVDEGELVAATRGLLEPPGRRLGQDAVATADVVLTPGLAVAADGVRLGRGGGSYDRALGRVPLGTFTCTLLYDDEFPLEVPTAPHDRQVVAVARPAGVSLTGWARGRASGRWPPPPQQH